MKERRLGHHWAPPDFWIRNHTWDLVGRNCYLVCHVHHHLTLSKLVARQWRHPHLPSLLIPCALGGWPLPPPTFPAPHRGISLAEPQPPLESWLHGSLRNRAVILQPRPVGETEGGEHGGWVQTTHNPGPRRSDAWVLGAVRPFPSRLHSTHCSLKGPTLDFVCWENFLFCFKSSLFFFFF